jgi:hypothetical protein
LKFGQRKATADEQRQFGPRGLHWVKPVHFQHLQLRGGGDAVVAAEIARDAFLAGFARISDETEPHDA